MWNTKTFREFIARFKKLDLSHQLLVVSCLLLALLYAGHNPLQTIIITPAPVRAYTLPTITPSLYPDSDGTRVPPLSARSVIIQDVGSKAILYSRSPDTLMMPASITKVMTALVALDHWEDLQTVVTVKNEDRAIGQTIDLVQGEQITVGSLLAGLLVHSGNDAALAVAENYVGGYSAFVAAMNAKAKSLHMDHTTFKNPSGVEQYGHLTTARDIATMAAVAIQNETVARLASTKRIVITDVSGDIIHDLETTNELLGVVEGLKGLKTGWTTQSGECLVSYIERDGREIIIVVLGSADRFGDTAALVEWVYDHHEWIIPSI